MKHKSSDVQSEKIGKGTNVWQYSVVLPDASIGDNCNICAHCFIENNVRIGNNVTIKSGVQLWDGIIIEDNVFVGPNVAFTNDKFPRSKVYPDSFLETKINSGASIGAGAIILPGITIGSNAMVGAGAVIISDVPENAVVVGNPAHVIGYTSIENEGIIPVLPIQSDSNDVKVKGVTLHEFPVFHDERGKLAVGEFNKEIPFIPKRYFSIFGVPNNEVRGEHAHKECHQFLICINGRCNVVVDDGKHRQEFILDGPSKGIYLPPLTWGIQYKYSENAVLIVYASEYYDPDDYVKKYCEFKELVG